VALSIYKKILNMFALTFLGYILILTSFLISFGSFLEIPVLAAGRTTLIYFAWKGSLENLFRKYLKVNA